MKERGFDMLENADDRNIERLSEHSVLTEKEKARLLKMSMDKMNRRINDTEDAVQVSGVEQYKRPRWYTFAAAAACLVLAIGAVGTAIYLGGRGSAPDIEPLATTETATETTEAVTEAPTEEDLVKVADEMLNELIEFENFTRGYMVGTDVNMTKEVETDEGTVVYERVLDYDTIEEVKEHYSEYFTEAFLNSFKALWDEGTSAPMMNVIDGKLYFRDIRIETEPALYSFTVNDKIEITAQDENSFSFTRSGLDMNDVRRFFDVACVREEGKWKISSCICSEYDSEAETTEPTAVPE